MSVSQAWCDLKNWSTRARSGFGSAGISLVLSVIAMAIAFVGFGGGFVLYDNGYQAVALIVLGASAALFLTVVLVSAALSGIYSAAVYRYAVDGTPPDGFGDGLIESAFKQKGR